MPDKIFYDDSIYDTVVDGEDEKYAGGIWDLAGAVADDLIDEIDECLQDSKFEDKIPVIYEVIQEKLYNLIKYNVLGIEDAVEDDNEM